MPALSLSQWLLAVIGATCLGIGKAGFAGMSLVHVLIFAFLFGARSSTGVVLPMLLVGDVCAVSVFHQHARWDYIRRMLPPAGAGIVLGAVLMRSISDGVFRPIIGWIILTLTALQIARMKRPAWFGDLPHSQGFAWGIGLLAGATTMLANAAGPIFAIYAVAIGLPKFEIVGTGAWFFFIVNALKVPFSFALGLIHGQTLLVNLALTPAILAGILMGRWLTSRVPQRLFDGLLLAFAALAALRLIVESPVNSQIPIPNSQAGKLGSWALAEGPSRPEIDRSGRPNAESADMLPGSKIGPYEIIESIGRGGMGEVYRAHDARLRRNVAIKTVAAGLLADPTMRERFDREARAVAALSHPNILAIYDVGDCDGIPYVAVELLEGDTLRPHLGTSPLPLSTALDYAVQIGRGLAAAHDRGIVHRDLKPANIFVTRDGQVKLLDFGLATEPAGELGDEATRLARTEAGLVLGTAGYMSPEQARGEHADTRSDIFSFGCVLYEMLAARRAFAGDTRMETLHAVLKEHPPDLTNRRSDVPQSLNRVVRRCLEKAPENRFQTARDLVFALENLTSGSEPAPAPSRPGAARRALGAAAVIVALLAAGAAWWWTAMRKPAPQETASHVQSPEDRPRLLAVLPFENISGSSEGYFAQGMTQEVTNQLSKLSALRVIGSGAVAQFKDPRRQLSALAKELGIGSAITGTVRQQGSQVRVNVELIDAQSGQVIWSEQYDREGVDVFAAQSDIAVQVGRALNASVTLAEQARIGKRPTSSIAAYELFVRARTVVGRTNEDRLRARIELLSRAVVVDPQFAQAYSDMANAYYFLGAYGDRSALARGVEAGNTALRIDPELASGYRGLALNLNEMGRLREALPAYLKAVTLNPSYGAGLVDFAHGLVTAGRYDESLGYALRAQRLNPNARGGGYHQGAALVLLDDDARSERFLTAALARAPNDTRLQMLLAFLDLRRGRPQVALDRIRAAVEKTPTNIEALLPRAEIGTFAGAPDAADHVASLFERAADGLFHTAPYPVKLAHAYHLHRRGASAGARKIMDQILATNRRALADGADSPAVFLQNAAVYALQGDGPAALDELERSYAAGWRDWRTLAIDPFFTSVRSEPRFTRLLSRIESDVAAMRARADYSGLP